MFINHWHVTPKGVVDKQDPKKGTLEQMQEIMNNAKIDNAIAFAPFVHLMPWDTNYYIKYQTEKECNEWLFQELKKYPNIFGFVTVNPKRGDSCKILIEYVNKGFVGAKIHPPIFQVKIDAPYLDKFYFTAEQLKIPVLFHTGVHGWKLEKYMPILLDNVAQKHPELKIIIEHMGGLTFFEQALAVLHNNKNTYAGITQCSGRDPRYTISAERVKLLLDTVGANRIIYGLDYPYNYNNLKALNNDIEWIHSWNISREEEKKILGDNLKEILKKE